MCVCLELNSMRFFFFLRSQKINMEVFKRSNLNQAQLPPPTHCHDGPLVVAMANSRVEDKGERMLMTGVG